MTPPTNDPEADKKQRMADVDALVERRQGQVQAEQERQEERLEGLQEVAKLQHTELSEELKVIERKRAIAAQWRTEQKEKKRALALDRLRKQQLLEHELKLKAEAKAAYEKQQAYMDHVHRIAAQKRLKAAQHAAEREEEEQNTDAERREHAANLDIESHHHMALLEAERRAESRRKELENHFKKRRQDVDTWARRQVLQITSGATDELTIRDRLTPDQRRRVLKVEQEKAHTLEAVALEERQQRSALDATLAREKQQAETIYRQQLEVTSRGRKQSENLAAARREETVDRATVRAANYGFGSKQTNTEKEQQMKEQAQKVARRQPRNLF